MNLCLYMQALDAYKVVCDKHMTVYDRKGNEYSMLFYCVPSYRLSIVGRKYVYLRNCNGELARYVIKTGEIII